MTQSFDPRRTPARADLAAADLRDSVSAAAYAEGVDMVISAPAADLRLAPERTAEVATQALYGEALRVFEIKNDWVWGQLAQDGYVGYLPAWAVAPGSAAPTHKAREKITFLYPRPNMKAPPLFFLPFGARIAQIGVEGDFIRTPQGFVYARHFAPLEETVSDFVAFAESLIGAPYLWGGKTPWGIDCSGLAQLSLQAAGRAAPRDSDMQARELGRPFDWTREPLQRGDFIFWKGHIGIMRDARVLLHANAFHMLVASEPFAEARSRILANGSGDVTIARRLEDLA